jgi:hypothetical protein
LLQASNVAWLAQSWQAKENKEEKRGAEWMINFSWAAMPRIGSTAFIDDLTEVNMAG